jgi:uncharacterized membrane protein YraQ (UPF0718 family)
MIEVLSRLKEKNINEYWLLLIGMFIVSFVNSLIYYSIATSINGTPENILTLLLTSFIGKIVALICSLGAFYLTNKLEQFMQKRSQNKSK